MPIAGVVLCGGRSSRMGRPKAWLPVGGELMLQRVVRVLREAADPVVVVAAPGQDLPPLPDDVEIVRDEIEGRGPLGGLAAGLAAGEGKADAVYLSACDAPFLTADFVRGVVAGLDEVSREPESAEASAAGSNLTPRPPSLRGKGEQEGGSLHPDAPPSALLLPSPRRGGAGGEVETLPLAVVPHVGGRPHPLAAAYRLTVLPEVRRMLAAGEFRMTALLERVPTRFLGPDDLPDLAPLRNINTPEEYEATLRELTG